jgi:hypothetical protein
MNSLITTTTTTTTTAATNNNNNSVQNSIRNIGGLQNLSTSSYHPQ